MKHIIIYYNHISDKKIFNYTILIRTQALLNLKTKDIIEDIKKLEDLFDFSNLDENHELFSNKNKKVIGIFKIETPKNIWIDKFICLRSKMYALKCGNDSKNKLKGISQSQSKHIKFEEYKKSLDGENCQRESNKYILRSFNHEMYHQEVKNRHYLYSMINDVI